MLHSSALGHWNVFTSCGLLGNVFWIDGRSFARSEPPQSTCAARYWLTTPSKSDSRALTPSVSATQTTVETHGIHLGYQRWEKTARFYFLFPIFT